MIWAAVLGFGFVVVLAYGAKPPESTRMTASPQIKSKPNDGAANRCAGYEKMMVTVTKRLDAFGRCDQTFIAKVMKDEDAAKCVTAALVLYNNSRGKADLEQVPKDDARSIAVGCMMIKHGDTEEVVEYIMSHNG
jgi:hypothetical protein